MRRQLFAPEQQRGRLHGVLAQRAYCVCLSCLSCSLCAAAKARGAHLRVHFKHCREIAQNIRGLKLAKAKKFLEDVLQYKQAVVFTRFAGGVGRHAQGKQSNAPGDKCRWPQKATKVILDLV